MNDIDEPRRSFLKASLGAAVVAIAPGMLLFDVAHGKTEDASRPGGASNKVRWGMLIDTTQCKPGCNDCVTACNRENGLSGGTKPTDSQWIRKIELKDVSSGRELSLPMMCQHCEHPPCVDVCPTTASFKRADGIVLVDKHRCIGCRYCLMACPYKARSFVHEPLHDQNPDVPRGKGTAEACTLCVHRIDKGLQPACAEACRNKAILFGDLNDANSEIASKVRSVASIQVRADLRLNPGIRYQGL
ncbi:MAG: 4Fe-4S dicluster domain-containing protein [Nitrosomonadales bacterium]|nr:4Fe-4S dicluster domain-containing protein [Nitrosomonadales bacterium]